MPLQSRPITAMWANMELGLAGWMAKFHGGTVEALHEPSATVKESRSFGSSAALV